jgi:hypothetical protein
MNTEIIKNGDKAFFEVDFTSKINPGILEIVFMIAEQDNGCDLKRLVRIKNILINENKTTYICKTLHSAKLKSYFQSNEPSKGYTGGVQIGFNKISFYKVLNYIVKRGKKLDSIHIHPDHLYIEDVTEFYFTKNLTQI